MNYYAHFSLHSSLPSPTPRSLSSATAAAPTLHISLLARPDPVVRHDTKQDDGLSKYGWIRHNGVTFGQQTIDDPQTKLSLETTFLKQSDGVWSLSVAASPSAAAAALAGPTLSPGTTVMIAVGSGNDKGSSAKKSLTPKAPSTGNGVVEMAGMGLAGLADFAVRIAGASTDGSMVPVAVWAQKGVTPLTVKTKVANALRASDTGNLPNKQDAGAEVVVVQFAVTALPARFELVFASGADNDADDGAANKQAAAAAAQDLYIKEAKALAKFDVDFATKFSLEEAATGRAGAGGITKGHVEFARASFSAVLGSHGFFYGESKIRTDDGEEGVTAAGPLYTGVPCRPFFPRGFLWDEGFHQLVVAPFAPSITLDVLAHWFGRIQPDGWLPREQILGAEAEQRVPREFMTQTRTHANPPTFLLTVERLLADSSAGKLGAEDKEVLLSLYPWVKKWFAWFQSSQRGKGKGAFRWRGRDSGDGKLNAMTLVRIYCHCCCDCIVVRCPLLHAPFPWLRILLEDVTSNACVCLCVCVPVCVPVCACFH